MMKRKSWAAVTAVAVVAVTAGVVGASTLVRADRHESSPLAVQTSFPGLPTPDAEPGLASMRTVHPQPGEVAEAKGPFDDRFEFQDLALSAGAVTGAVLVTSDVSDVLELEVVAGFYDAEGKLLGTDRFVHHLADHGGESHGAPVEREEFRIAVPAALAERAVSVAVGVPVLVNE